MVTKSPVKVYKVGRMLVSFQCIHEPQPDDQERINKTFQIVDKIKLVAKDAESDVSA